MLHKIAPLKNDRGVLEAEAQKTVLLSETGKFISVLGECTSHHVTPTTLSCHPSILSWSSELETSCVGGFTLFLAYPSSCWCCRACSELLVSICCSINAQEYELMLWHTVWVLYEKPTAVFKNLLGAICAVMCYKHFTQKDLLRNLSAFLPKTTLSD